MRVARMAGLLLVIGLALGIAGCYGVAPVTTTLAPQTTAGSGSPPIAGNPAPSPAGVQQFAVQQVPKPEPVAPGPLDEAQLRSQLIATREALCQDLELASSIILNVGILSQFPPKIQAAAGMSINELEVELQVCSSQDDASKTTAELVDEVRQAEWLAKIHLTAMESATLEKSQPRPVDAEGSIAAFLSLHDVIIAEMRYSLAGLTDGDPTLADARQMGSFWQDVLAPHAQAEDDALFPLARASGDAGLARSADVIEEEHGPIEAGIEAYMQTLAAVEQGHAVAGDLIPLARDVRSAVELHFGREEATIIRPLQTMLGDEQFRPAVGAQDAAIGPWLRQYGWDGLPATGN